MLTGGRPGRGCFRLGEGVALQLVVEGVAHHQHTAGCQLHHKLQAGLVARMRMQSSQLCPFDIEQASSHLMAALVQLLAAEHMHRFADHNR